MEEKKTDLQKEKEEETKFKIKLAESQKLITIPEIPKLKPIQEIKNL